MTLQVIKEIDIDFYDNQIITVNAKQYDTSRCVLIKCYVHGVRFYLNSDSQSVFVRYKKEDEYSVFNSCEITKDGNVLVELTEQMLVDEGLCIIDLLIVDRSNITPPEITEDGEITLTSEAIVISTMKFYVNVISAPYEYDDLESSDEFQGLNDLFDKAYQDYSEVITLSKANQEAAESAADAAAQSETNAKTSENNAKASENAAKESEDNAKDSEINAQSYASNASTSATNAENYSNLSKSYAIGESGVRDGEDTDNSKYYSEQAQSSATSASSSATAAKTSEDNAKDSETNAQTYASNASTSATNAEASAQAAAESAAQAAAEADLSSMIQLSSEEPNAQPVNGLWFKEIE